MGNTVFYSLKNFEAGRKKGFAKPTISENIYYIFFETINEWLVRFYTSLQNST